MTPARTRGGGNPEGTQDEAAKECPPAADSTVHENVLVLLQFGPVVFFVTRAVLDVRSHDADIPPPEIRAVYVIRPEVPEHPASPIQGFVGFVPVDHHTEIPSAQILERWIEFAIKKGLFIVKVALYGIYRIGCVVEGRGV